MRLGVFFRIVVAAAAIVFLAAGVTVYTIWDNRRVVVVEQEITMERLPEPFDGFTILQITDLHSKRFGPEQAILLEQMNALEYDAVVITGDMINNRNRSLDPFYELLAGLDTTKPILFAGGNTDPQDYFPYTGEVRPFGQELQRRGVTLLNEPAPVTRDGARLWFTAWQDGAVLEDHRRSIREELVGTDSGVGRGGELETQAVYVEEIQRFWAEVDPGEVKIALTHYPASRRYRERRREAPDPHYDLFIAGHYHGGQFRIPLLGAIYVPDWTSWRGGLFPDQNEVSGLMGPAHSQQYISRGLGATDIVPLLAFRLFNPPEINLLRLRTRH